MLIKNQIYECQIADYTAEGQGVARIEGCAVFIPNAIVGEVCTVRIEKAQKTWAAGKIVEILKRSPHRINRECPVAKLCGGCDFWHMDYAEETRLKAERVRSCLNRLGGEALETVPILSAPDCHGYRNKAQYPVASKNGRAYAGFFKAGTHSVVENDRCLILPPESDAVKNAVIDYVNQYRIPVYDEASHTGLLRHIYVRRGAVSGQILVCLAVNGRKLPHTEDLIRRLQKIPGFATLVLSVNQKVGNAVLGDEFITLYGPGWIEDTLCGLNFRLSPRSFYQVNHHQAQRLYRAAIEQAGITKSDTVLDLYCGVGTITLAMAEAAGRVIGVEVIPQAVEDARDNARRNGIENAEFLCADAGQAALELERSGVKADVAIVDPPRKGLNTDTIEALARMAPRRIVYVSCDPATLARDVALLKGRGYALESAMAADLFPRCAHVESVCTLVKANHSDNALDLRYIYEQLKDKYDLELTTGLALDAGFDRDMEVLTGKSILGRFYLYDEGYHYILNYDTEEGIADKHWHPADTAEAQELVAAFMAGTIMAHSEGNILPPQQITDESVVCLDREATHEMKLHASPFEMIKSGAKTIELRLYDEKRQKIKTGDRIIFTNTVNGEKLCATVKKLHLFESFEALYKALPLLQCGYTADDIDTAHPSDMEQYYSAEEQKQYGVVGIELSPEKHK